MANFCFISSLVRLASHSTTFLLTLQTECHFELLQALRYSLWLGFRSAYGQLLNTTPCRVPVVGALGEESGFRYRVWDRGVSFSCVTSVLIAAWNCLNDLV